MAANQDNTSTWSRIYGKGFEMLIRMGYNVNMGLGREGQGRMDPIEVTVRPRNRGLGYASEEEENDPAPEEIFFEEEDEEEQVRRFKAEAASLDKALKEEAAEANRGSRSSPPTFKVRNPTKKDMPAPSFIIMPKDGTECNQKVLPLVPYADESGVKQEALVPYGSDVEDDAEIGVKKQALVPYESDSEDDAEIGVKKQVKQSLVPYESDSEDDAEIGVKKQVKQSLVPYESDSEDEAYFERV